MEKQPIQSILVKTLPTAVTHGIRVVVDSYYAAEHSAPQAHHWQFAYHVTITNEGEQMARLASRRLQITDALGELTKIQGLGVLGEQPRLEAGESYSYTSQCDLKTPFGGMEGSYTMISEDGTRFDADIPPILLALPQDIN